MKSNQNQCTGYPAFASTIYAERPDPTTHTRSVLLVHGAGSPFPNPRVDPTRLPRDSA